MKKLSCYLISLALGVFMCSCQKEQVAFDQEYSISTSIEVDEPLCLQIDGNGTKAVPFDGVTKTSFTSPDINKVNSVLLVLADQANPNQLNDNQLIYLTNIVDNHITFNLPSLTAVYDIYVLANFGDLRSYIKSNRGSKSVSAYMDSFTYKFPNYGIFDTDGFPMSTKVENYSVTNKETIRVKRLVSRLRLDFDIPEGIKVTMKDLKLYQCASRVSPFSESYAITSTSDRMNEAYNDRLSASDLQSISRGEDGYYYLYLFENAQGVCFDGNDNPKAKTPDKAGFLKKDLVSYVAFNATVTVPGDEKKYGNVKYSFCLGNDDCTDYSVDKNTFYNISVNFGEVVSAVDWQIIPDDPIDIFNLKWIYESRTSYDDMGFESPIEWHIHWQETLKLYIVHQDGSKEQVSFRFSSNEAFSSYKYTYGCDRNCMGSGESGEWDPNNIASDIVYFMRDSKVFSSPMSDINVERITNNYL